MDSQFITTLYWCNSTRPTSSSWTLLVNSCQTTRNIIFIGYTITLVIHSINPPYFRNYYYYFYLILATIMMSGIILYVISYLNESSEMNWYRFSLISIYTIITNRSDDERFYVSGIYGTVEYQLNSVLLHKLLCSLLLLDFVVDVLMMSMKSGEKLASFFCDLRECNKLDKLTIRRNVDEEENTTEQIESEKWPRMSRDWRERTTRSNEFSCFGAFFVSFFNFSDNTGNFSLFVWRVYSESKAATMLIVYSVFIFLFIRRFYSSNTQICLRLFSYDEILIIFLFFLLGTFSL